MSSDPTSSPTVDEAARRRFEAAWRQARPGPIEQFLPAENDPHFLPTLEELVLIELELAWKASAATLGGDAPPAAPAPRPPLVEDYLTRFPALNRPEVVRRLLEQEFRVRRRWGDRPAADDYRGRFPSLPLTLDEAIPPPTGGELPTIPGYEVLEELGRGGMGVVYKARQVGLNRLVALKMILAGPYASEEGRARFRAEAEAVAALRHPNIVQIHEIGECGGAPYFALEYVEGGTLAQKLGGAPQPARRAAETVETLARAVASAHQRGVVHRDLKPANVLLTAEGTLKIADFGLAKRLEENAGQTRTGEVVGTPSYMAPEQAAGKRKEIGTAVDVYALGAILYETLTGRPPFRAESSLETLQQVLVDEPVPPRRLQPRAPRDLELIALKCLRKRPRDRYPDAEALADDLRRFRSNEPVRARPAPPWERAAKWARRRPAAAALLLAAVLAVIALLAGAWWHDAQLRAERDETERQKTEAQTQRDEAERRKKEAEDQGEKARDRFRRARDAVDAMVQAANRLYGDPKAEAVRTELLNKSLTFYDGLLDVEGDDPELRRDAARAYRQKGNVENLLGHGPEAEDAYRRAAEMQKKLVEEFPHEPDHRNDLATTYNDLGTLLQTTGRPDAEVEEAYQSAAKWGDPLVTEFPDRADYRQGVATIHNNLGQLRSRQRRLEDARTEHNRALTLRNQSFQESPDKPEYRQNLAFSYNNRGLVYEDLNRWDDAEADFRQASTLIDEKDGDPEARRVRAAAYDHLAQVLAHKGGPAKERNEATLAAYDIRKQLFEDFPARPDCRFEMAVSCIGLGRIYSDEPAAESYGQAIDLLRVLVRDHAERAEFKSELGNALQGKAVVRLGKSKTREALELLTEAIAHQRAAVEASPHNRLYLGRLRDHTSWLVDVLIRLKRHDEAVKKAEELPEIVPDGWEEYHRAAWFLSRCIPIAETDADLPEGKGKEIADAYAAWAIALLRLAVSHGFKDAEGLKNDPDFAPLRERAAVEFQNVLNQIGPPP